MFAYASTTLILLIVSALLYVYRYFKKSHQFFRRHRIPHIEPHWLFGNVKDIVLMKKAHWLGTWELYKKFKDEKLAGIYSLHTPSIMIRDPELIKLVLVKDFDYFQDRGIPVHKDIEPLTNNMFNLTGDEWKQIRSKLTNTFTNDKMQNMFTLMKKCAQDIEPTLSRYFQNGQDFEGKDLCARYTTDVIGSCAFGIDIHSLQDPEAEIRKMGRNIFKPRWQQTLRLAFPTIPVFLIKHLRLDFFQNDVCDYFMKIFKEMIKYREENNIAKGDFLDLLIELKNKKKLNTVQEQQPFASSTKFTSKTGKKLGKNDAEITIELIAAQCFIFFFGGFEGGSSTLMYMLFELARKPEIQKKVRKEILSMLESNGGELTYDAMKSMPYLNMIIDETSRKYPAIAATLFRQCLETYKIPNSELIIEAGTRVIIPTVGLHYDEKYFEKPNDFYPEHFTREAKLKRHPYVYMPFGEGPRTCIAQRFARMQMTVGAVYLLKDFSFEVSPKTKVPLEFAPGASMIVKDGLWLRCRPL